jgi:hypothetical protein
MISALQRGKYSVDRKEDVLTSSFFDCLFLLPDAMIWDIIRNSCYDKEILPETAGNLLRDETDFWPSWNPKGTNNTLRVELDLFLRFDEIDIIIEAKQEWNSQGIEQWKNEYISYDNEYGTENKKAILIAIDGIEDTQKETREIKINGKKKELTVIKTKWQSLYETVIKKCHAGKINEQQQNLILDTIIKYFSYFRIYKIEWSQTLVDKNYQLKKYQPNMKLLNQLYGLFKGKNNEDHCCPVKKSKKRKSLYF